MGHPKIGAALSLLLVVSFTGCGGTAIAPKALDYSAIQGNWHLTGQGPFSSAQTQSPLLTLAIARSGNTLYATGAMFVACQQNDTWLGGPVSGVGLPLTADINSDGTFLLTNASSPSSPVQFAIHGSVPSAGDSGWEGTYRIFNSSSSLLSCAFSESGSFHATAYSPLRGTYSGTVTGTGFASGVSVTLQVAQGEPTIIPGGQVLLSGLVSVTRFYIPLTGTIAINGSPCFTTGTFTSDGNSSITGDRFTILATMNDGTPVLLSGWLADQSEATLASVQLDVTTPRGPCANAFGNGSLALQP